VDEATEDVAPLDDVVYGSGREGYRATLAQALMRAPLIVVGGIVLEHMPEVPLVHDEQAI